MLRSLFLALLLLGCDSGKKLGVVGATCGASSDCSGELQCIATTCVDPKSVAEEQSAKLNFADSKIAQGHNDVVNIQKACEQYMLQKAECPKNVEDLKTAGIISRVQKDPWGEAFAIRCPGEADAVDVMSPGPDRVLGGADDIRSSDKRAK